MMKNLLIVLLAIAAGGVGAVLSKGTGKAAGPVPTNGKIISGAFNTSFVPTVRRR